MVDRFIKIHNWCHVIFSCHGNKTSLTDLQRLSECTGKICMDLSIVTGRRLNREVTGPTPHSVAIVGALRFLNFHYVSLTTESKKTIKTTKRASYFRDQKTA